MNQLLKTCILILFISFSTQLNAQFLKKLGERVEERVKETTSRKVENKAGEKTDKVLDKILSPQSNRQQRERQDTSGDESRETNSDEDQEVDVDGMLQNILGGGKEVKFEDSYRFTFTATMEVTDFTEENETMTTQQSYSNEAALTQLPQGLALVDYRTESVVILDESNKTGQAMSLSWMKRMMKNQNTDVEQSDDVQIIKTGRTRTINGHRCAEYTMTDEEGKTVAWVATDVGFSYEEFAKSMGGMFGADMGQVETGDGYPMQITNYDTDGEKTYEMTVAEISTQARIIKMSDYEITKMF